MYRLLYRANIPRYLKVLLIILLTLTCVYWIGALTYNILKYLRIIIHWCSEENQWWTFIVCVLILLIGSFLIAQFALELNPLGNFIEWIKDLFIDLKNYLKNNLF